MPEDLVLTKLEPKKEGDPSFLVVLRNLLIYYVLCSCLSSGPKAPRRSSGPVVASDRRLFGRKTKAEAKNSDRRALSPAKMNGDQGVHLPTISAKVDADERDGDPTSLKNLPFIDSEDPSNLKYILPDRIGFDEPINLHIPASLLMERPPPAEFETPGRDRNSDRDSLFSSGTKNLLENEIHRIENNLSKTVAENISAPQKIERSGSSVKSLDFLPVLESLKRNEEEIEEVRKSYYEKSAEKEEPEMRGGEIQLPEISAEAQKSGLDGGCADPGLLRFEGGPKLDELRETPSAVDFRGTDSVERRPRRNEGAVVVVTTIVQSPTVTLTEVTKQFSDNWKEYEITSRRSSDFGGTGSSFEHFETAPADEEDDLRDLRLTVQSERGDPKHLTEESARVVCQPRDARIADEYLTNLSHMLVDDCRRFHENDAPDPVVEGHPLRVNDPVGQLFNDLSVNVFEEDRDTNVGSSYNPSLVSAAKSADSPHEMIIHLKSSRANHCDRLVSPILKKADLEERDPPEKDFPYPAAFKTVDSPPAVEDINDRRAREATAFAQKFFAV